MQESMEKDGNWGGKRKSGNDDSGSKAKKARWKGSRDRLKVCTHEVSVPEGYDEAATKLDPGIHGTLQEPIYTGKPAKEYSFELDPFQKKAVACLERRESVLVAAHTSAGKTVVAEYATAMSFRDNQRILYTSPLKALSNQKFRDFSAMFESMGGKDCVGLMTGEAVINPSANFIVMTTEILRSMLYNGSEILREVAWVVFDEVHYMKDKERGVVWEETIILLPPKTGLVFLSATLPNAREFADWVTSLHGNPCHVIYTDFRPTPLKHYGFPIGGDGLYFLKDGDGDFFPERFGEMMKQLDAGDSIVRANGIEENAQGRWKKKKNPRCATLEARGQLVDIVRVCKENNFLPAIIFCFIKAEAEATAGLLGKVSFNSPKEQEQVGQVFDSALAGLSDEDRDLPSISHIRPLLVNGVGTHHSGLLPIIKEITEILFQESLIKVLCATETFAMGLNMPARTVIFSALFKFDGEVMRQLTSGEYIQMSGRAGRRDVDDVGFVIMMVNSEMSEKNCKAMVSGSSDPLQSSFRLTYYTLLNLLRRVEGTQQTMGDIIKKSFQEFQHRRRVPELKARLKLLEEKAEQISLRVNDAQIVEYNETSKNMAVLENEIMRESKEGCMAFLRPGRLIKVKEWGWGVVMSVIAEWGSSTVFKKTHLVDTMLCCDRYSDEKPNARPLKPAALHRDAYTAVLPVPLSMIDRISTLCVDLPGDLRTQQTRRPVLKNLCSLVAIHREKIPTIDVCTQLHVTDPLVLPKVKELADLKSKKVSNPVHKVMQDSHGSSAVEKKVNMHLEAEELKEKIAGSFFGEFCEEAKAMTAVLRRLGHVNASDVVQLKGKVACEIDAGNSLICVELLFDGVFDTLDIPSSVSIATLLLQMSERSFDDIKNKRVLAEPFSKVMRTVEMIADVCIECKQDIDKEKFMELFNPCLMDVMYAWSKGESFVKVCDMTEVFEGAIVRGARRLDELLTQLREGASVMGNHALAKKFSDCCVSIRRDVMFSPSLYV
ncbi:hypothetical protein BSKO_04160 [Bryopsis sp. KO-2023]|nr:hypothetical protein BSKO_04160 [Bryopsis sp. KO-2023]